MGDSNAIYTICPLFYSTTTFTNGHSILNSQTDKNRFIPIEGSMNLRDFGGYATHDGGMVLQGKLFRCGSLANIPEHAHDEFAALDIGVICDLRRQDEVEHGPSPITKPFQVRVHIPIAPGSSPQLMSSFQDANQTHLDRISFMQEITREIARDHVASYKKLFAELMAVENGFLLHCSAGKDRTGFGAAMIQLALGVSMDDVLADYLLTNSAEELFSYLMPRFIERFGSEADEKSLRVIAGVREEYLTTALAEVITQHGTYEGYMDAAGLDRNARIELRKRLVAK